MEIGFNVNDKVKFRLTKRGRQIFADSDIAQDSLRKLAEQARKWRLKYGVQLPLASPMCTDAALHQPPISIQFNVTPEPYWSDEKVAEFLASHLQPQAPDEASNRTAYRSLLMLNAALYSRQSEPQAGSERDWKFDIELVSAAGQAHGYLCAPDQSLVAKQIGARLKDVIQKFIDRTKAEAASKPEGGDNA